MEKINNFLNQIYGSNESAMTFYLILGVIALFFIILIITTLVKSKKETSKEEPKNLPNVETKEEVVDSAATEQPKEEEPKVVDSEEEVVKNEPLSETQVFNNVLMGKDEENGINDIFESKNSNVYLERPEVHEEPVPVEPEEVSIPESEPEEVSIPESEPEKEEIPVEEDNKLEQVQEESPSEEIKEEKIELPEVNLTEEKSISDFFNDDKPTINTIEVDAIEEGPVPIRDDFTMELPKVKPMDIDTYLSRRAETMAEEEPVKEEPIEEPKEEVVKLSNDELKERLAKLKKKKEEKTLPNDDLQDLMKAVGLEDTPKIEDEERHILGR